MTRIGLVGCGKWGRNAARAMAKAGVLAWVADANIDSAQTLAIEFGDVDIYDTDFPRQRWAAFDACDAVWICTPIETHELLVHAALSAGKHVLCEKPLARTKAQAVDLADEAKRRGLVLMCDFTWLGHRGVMDTVTDEPIVMYNAQRFAKDDRGFDAIEDLLPHDVAISARGLGNVERVSVSGRVVQCAHERGGSLMRYSYDSAEKVRHVSVLRTEPSELWVGNTGELPTGAPEPLSVILDTFLDAIRTGQPPSIGSADEFVHVAAVIEAAKKSRASGGGWVDVE